MGKKAAEQSTDKTSENVYLSSKDLKMDTIAYFRNTFCYTQCEG